MAGNKNSGRRPMLEEQLRRQTIQDAWKIVHAHLNSPDMDKRATAKDIVLKSMPSELRQDIKMDATILNKSEQDILNKYIERNRIQTN